MAFGEVCRGCSWRSSVREDLWRSRAGAPAHGWQASDDACPKSEFVLDGFFYPRELARRALTRSIRSIASIPRGYFRRCQLARMGKQCACMYV